MVLLQYPITGKINASDSSTDYPDVDITLRNTTKNSWSTVITESDGSFSFDLANFIGGYSNGDSLKIEAEIGSFFVSTTSTVDTNLPGRDFILTLSTETCLNIIKKYRVLDELTIFFRKNLTDPDNRGDVKTVVQSGTGSKVKFILPDRANCMYHVLVNDVVQTPYTDYYVEYNDRDKTKTTEVYFLSPPSNNSKVEFRYHYDTTWIYPDTPRTELSLDSYPRVGIRTISFRTTEAGLNADSNLTDILGTIDVYSDKENELEDLIQNIRTLILDNKKNFHYFKFITLEGLGPVLVSPNRIERILQQSQDFIIKLRLEVV